MEQQQQQQQQPAVAPAAGAGAAAAGPPAGRGNKIPVLNSTTPEAWLRFRPAYTLYAAIQHWDDAHAKQECFLALREKASDVLRDINYQQPDLTLDGLLDLYEARLVTPEAVAVSRREFKATRQRPDETIVEWHGRLRTLYRRVHPQLVDVEHAPDLIEKFAEGAADQEVYKLVTNLAPDTYTMALVIAQRQVVQQGGGGWMGRLNAIDAPEAAAAEEPTMAAMRGRGGWRGSRGNGRGRGRGTYNGRGRGYRYNPYSWDRNRGPNNGKGQNGSDLCFYCGKPGHRKPDCPVKAEAMRARGGGRYQNGTYAMDAPQNGLPNEYGLSGN